MDEHSRRFRRWITFWRICRSLFQPRIIFTQRHCLRFFCWNITFISIGSFFSRFSWLDFNSAISYELFSPETITNLFNARSLYESDRRRDAELDHKDCRICKDIVEHPLCKELCSTICLPPARLSNWTERIVIPFPRVPRDFYEGKARSRPLSLFRGSNSSFVTARESEERTRKNVCARRFLSTHARVKGVRAPFLVHPPLSLTQMGCALKKMGHQMPRIVMRHIFRDNSSFRSWFAETFWGHPAILFLQC